MMTHKINKCLNQNSKSKPQNECVTLSGVGRRESLMKQIHITTPKRNRKKARTQRRCQQWWNLPTDSRNHLILVPLTGKKKNQQPCRWGLSKNSISTKLVNVNWRHSWRLLHQGKELAVRSLYTPNQNLTKCTDTQFNTRLWETWKKEHEELQQMDKGKPRPTELVMKNVGKGAGEWVQAKCLVFRQNVFQQQSLKTGHQSDQSGLKLKDKDKLW